MQKFNSSRSHVLRALGLVAAVVAVPAFAQSSGSMDVSSVTADISEGLVALATVGAAWVGFKYLKKVWNRI